MPIKLLVLNNTHIVVTTDQREAATTYDVPSKICYHNIHIARRHFTLKMFTFCIRLYGQIKLKRQTQRAHASNDVACAREVRFLSEFLDFLQLPS